MRFLTLSVAALLLSFSTISADRLARPVAHFPLKNQFHHIDSVETENQRNAKLYHVPLIGYPFNHHPNNPEKFDSKNLLDRIKSQLKAAGLRYGLKKENSGAQFHGNTNKVSVDAGTSEFEFIGKVGFGTPPQYFKARFDSSSAISLVVKGTHSYSDYYKDSYYKDYYHKEPHSSNGYFADKSSTFKNLGKSVTVYNTTTQKSSTFKLYEDLITVGNGSYQLCAPGPFAKVEKEDWTFGSHVLASFGLGPKAKDSKIIPWFDNLVNQGECAPYYALYPPQYTSNGAIAKHAQATFCGLDDERTKYSGGRNASWIPSKPSKKGFWELGIESFKCGDEDLLQDEEVSYETPYYDSYDSYNSYETPYETPYATPTPYYEYKPKKEFTGLLDSGSVQFRFPSAILAKINKKIGAKCSYDEPDLCTVDCKKVSSLPTFELGFDVGTGKTQKYKITPKEYVLKSGYGECVSGFSGYGCKPKNKYRRKYDYDDYGNDYDYGYYKYEYDEYVCDEPENEIVIGGVFFQSNIAIYFIDVEEEYAPPPKPKPSPAYVPEKRPEYSPEYKPEYTPEYFPSPEVKYKPSPVYEPSPYKTPEPTDYKPEPSPSPYKERRPEPSTRIEEKPEPSPEKRPEPSPEKKPEPSPEKRPEPSPEKKPEPSEKADIDTDQIPRFRPGLIRRPVGPPHLHHVEEMNTERLERARFDRLREIHRLRNGRGRIYRREEFIMPDYLPSPTGMGSALMFISAY